MMIYEQIGKKIEELRNSRGISQQVLANILGYESSTAVHLLERGARKISIDKLKVIANYFEVSIDQLLKEDTNQTKTDLLSALRSDPLLDEEDIRQVSNFVEFLKKKN